MFPDDCFTIISVFVVDADYPIVNDACPLWQAPIQVLCLVLRQHVQQQRTWFLATFDSHVARQARSQMKQERRHK